jgi:hypothetical protein
MTFTKAALQECKTTYNNLSDDVDAAYAALKQNRNRLSIIRGALKIIRRHLAQDYLGLFLLHRHFDCTAGRLFVERCVNPRAAGHPPVLVTTQLRTTKMPSRYAPHRFQFAADGGLQPLEFTTDRVAISASKRLTLAAELRQELGAYLSINGFSSVLGVGVFPRTGTLAQATSVFLEDTKFEKLQSVVHILPRLPQAPGRLIPTLWTFGSGGNGCCSQECTAYCQGHNSTTGLGYCGHRKSGHIGCV